MSIVKTLIICIQFLSAFGVIGLILLQHGKGAEMGAAFGSSSAGSLFGATGSANFLSRTTAVLAILFFTCTLALTFLGSNHSSRATGVLGTTETTSDAAASQTKQERTSSTDSGVPQ